MCWPASGSPRRTVWDPRDRLWTCAASDEVDARRVESLESERDVMVDLCEVSTCATLAEAPHSRMQIFSPALKMRDDLSLAKR